MNWIDVIYLIILIVTGLIGFWKGMIKLVVAFIALVLAILFGGWLSQALSSAAGWEEAGSASGSLWQILAFVFITIVLFGILNWIGTRLEVFVKFAPLGWINKAAGAGLGILVGFTICGFISALLGMIVVWGIPADQPLADFLAGGALGSVQDSLKSAIDASSLTPAVTTYFTWFSKILPEVIDRAMDIKNALP